MNENMKSLERTKRWLEAEGKPLVAMREWLEALYEKPGASR